MKKGFWLSFFRGLFLAAYLGSLAGIVYAVRAGFLPAARAALPAPEGLPLGRVLPEFNNTPEADAFTVSGRRVFPAFRFETGTDPDGVEIHYLELLGFAFRYETPGTYGPIEFLIGVDPYGRVTGVELLALRERQGIGESFLKQTTFIEAFKDKTIADLEGAGARIPVVAQAVDISSQVSEGVRGALEFFQGAKPEMMKAIADKLAAEVRDVEEDAPEMKTPVPQMRTAGEPEAEEAVMERPVPGKTADLPQEENDVVLP